VEGAAVVEEETGTGRGLRCDAPHGGGATLADTTGDLALKLRRPPDVVAEALGVELLGEAWVLVAVADEALLLRLLTFLQMGIFVYNATN